MNAITDIVKVLIFLVFLFGILVGALGDEALRWAVDTVNGFTNG